MDSLQLEKLKVPPLKYIIHLILYMFMNFKMVKVAFEITKKFVQLEGLCSVSDISLLKSSLLALPSDCLCSGRLASDLPSSAFSAPFL